LKELKKGSIFALAIGDFSMTHFGELAEWSNAAVLKTVEGHTSRGSNPLLSAKKTHNESYEFFAFNTKAKFVLAVI
jgi:hypothetical protein